MTNDINELLLKQPILLFDGECGFCNRLISFFLSREKNKKMQFVSLQSEQAKTLRSYFEIQNEVDSIILIRNNEAHIKSCATLRLTLYMKGLWPLMMVFVVVPPFLRNMVYNFIAKRRIKLFGRVENCALLSSEEKERFLDLQNKETTPVK